MSPKGIKYQHLGRISTIESPIKSTSRQLSHDQSEEDWIEVKGKNEKTLIVTKKRVTYSPASVGTPNPYGDLHERDEKNAETYLSPTGNVPVMRSKEIVVHTISSPKTPSPFGRQQQQSSQREAVRAPVGD